jgi:Phage integrase family
MTLSLQNHDDEAVSDLKKSLAAQSLPRKENLRHSYSGVLGRQNSKHRRNDNLSCVSSILGVDSIPGVRVNKRGPLARSTFAAAYRTVLLADSQGKEALSMLKRFLKGNQNPSALVFRSKRGSPLRETNVLHEFLHPVLKALGLPQAGMHAFRHGCNRRWELAGMNPAVLRQQMGHSSAVMTARYTGEIPLEQVRTAFSSTELENMENGGSVLAVA